MAMDSDFGVLILSHGRPDNVKTYRTLRRSGYTGSIFIVVDNEDDTLDRYRELYGDQVVVFDKAEVAKRIDVGDNFPKRNSVIYARNASFDIADRLGLEWFLELDDDYTSFGYRFDSRLRYVGRVTYRLDEVFGAYLDYFKSIPAASLALAQGGDFMGGDSRRGGQYINLMRKAMNSFFLSTRRRFRWHGRMNDDVNTYVVHGNRGLLFFTANHVSLYQSPTQKQEGGLTEMYMELGTYVKSFYTVMYMPSSVRIRIMGHRYHRLHHEIRWNNTVPKIISEDYQK